MNTFRIRPSSLKGSITIPPSKSHTLRAILFALMAKGKSVIYNYLPSPDTEAMIQAVRQLGAQVSIFPDRLEIEGVAGVLKPAENIIDAGNSGQVLRFVAALAALSDTYTIITGDHSIRHNRPVKPLLIALEQLGVFAVSSRGDGFAPIILRGPVKGTSASLSGEDSQPVSALLIAAAFLPQKTTIHVTNPGEKPWIDLTLHWLKKFGVSVQNDNYARYEITGGISIDGFTLTIPGDLSSAAYPIAAALVTDSELTIHQIDLEDVQGDKKLIDILIQMGGKMEYSAKEKVLRVMRGSQLKGMKVDINDFIDMITILPVIACFATGKTEIVNAGIARKKECDRIHAIATELKKMGAEIEESEEGLIITPQPLTGSTLQSYKDHRMTLSLSVAALGAKGESIIEGVECISKTYPSFKSDFQALGADLC